jgi:ankyrin repeat protein
MENGADINKQNNAGETPLMKACYFVEQECIWWMVTQKFKDVNVILTDYVRF